MISRSLRKCVRQKCVHLQKRTKALGDSTACCPPSATWQHSEVCVRLPLSGVSRMEEVIWKQHRSPLSLSALACSPLIYYTLLLRSAHFLGSSLVYKEGNKGDKNDSSFSTFFSPSFSSFFSLVFHQFGWVVMLTWHSVIGVTDVTDVMDPGQTSSKSLLSFFLFSFSLSLVFFSNNQGPKKKKKQNVQQQKKMGKNNCAKSQAVSSVTPIIEWQSSSKWSFFLLSMLFFFYLFSVCLSISLKVSFFAKKNKK